MSGKIPLGKILKLRLERSKGSGWQTGKHIAGKGNSTGGCLAAGRRAMLSEGTEPTSGCGHSLRGGGEWEVSLEAPHRPASGTSICPNSTLESLRRLLLGPPTPGKEAGWRGHTAWGLAEVVVSAPGPRPLTPSPRPPTPSTVRQALLSPLCVGRSPRHSGCRVAPARRGEQAGSRQGGFLKREGNFLQSLAEENRKKKHFHYGLLQAFIEVEGTL